MSGVCRVSDLTSGSCPCHKSPILYIGTFITGASSVSTNGLTTCSQVSLAVSSCGHMITVLTVSGTVTVEGTGVHRLGDISQNCGAGVSITGSGDVTAG